jgi:hypothetical protein
MPKIDLSRIKSRKVRDFITCQGLLSSRDFIKIQPTCFDPGRANDFHTHQEYYLIKATPDEVWNTYKTIHPAEAWCGHMISFGLQYSNRTGKVCYLDDKYHGMEVGVVVILNLKLFWGLLNIAVAHQIMEIDEASRTFKLCYMASGASEGSQWISLRETEEGFTGVYHETLYKSKSDFRDRKLYPRLHSRAVAEFHQNVKMKAESIVTPRPSEALVTP